MTILLILLFQDGTNIDVWTLAELEKVFILINEKHICQKYFIF